jgi:predicted secreted Zn-dependent protease
MPFVFILILLTLGLQGKTEDSYDSPLWKEDIASGYLPYHQLVAADFVVDDRAHPGKGMYTAAFFHYTYKYRSQTDGDHVTAHVTAWNVRSGFDRNESSRKSWVVLLPALLQHEQGHLDINEVHSRRFAKMRLTDLPVGQGVTSREAAADLKRKIKALSDQVSSEAQAEQDAYDTVTAHGANEAKQQDATQEIKRRLEQASIATWRPNSYSCLIGRTRCFAGDRLNNIDGNTQAVA